MIFQGIKLRRATEWEEAEREGDREALLKLLTSIRMWSTWKCQLMRPTQLSLSRALGLPNLYLNYILLGEIENVFTARQLWFGCYLNASLTLHSPTHSTLSTFHLPLSRSSCALASLMIWAVRHTLRMINILLALNVSASINNSSFANNGCQVSHKYFKLRAEFTKISVELSSCKVPQHPSGLALPLLFLCLPVCLAASSVSFSLTN